MQALCQGTHESRIGLLGLTNRRILFYKQSWTGSREEDFPLKEVDGIEFSKGMMSSDLAIQTPNGVVGFEGVAKKDGKRFADAVQLALMDF